MKIVITVSSSTLRFIYSVAALYLLAIPLRLQSATVSLSTGDNVNESSFNTSGHWSDGLAPSAANDYTVTNKNIRTPAAGGNYAFAGNSLTLTGSSYASPSLLVFKGTSTTDTLTVNNLNLGSYGGLTNGTTVSNFTFGGGITLNSANSFFQLTTGNGGFTVSSTISGSGTLNIYSNATSQSSAAITLTGNNTFSGGTVIKQYSYLIANSTNALGTGNVNVTGGLLKLSVADAIDDGAGVIISSGLTDTTLALYYSGTMTISSLSLNGGSSYLASGTYSISDLNSLYGFSIFIGDGITDSALIQVIPEPSTMLAFAAGLVIAAFAAAKKYRFKLASNPSA